MIPIGLFWTIDVGSAKFSTDVLTLPWQNWLWRASRGAGVRPEHVAVPLIGVASSLIGTARRVRASRSWSEPMTLWTCVVAASGDRKTPGLNVTLRALNRIEQAHFDLRIHRGGLPAVLFDFILDVLPFIEGAQSRARRRLLRPPSRRHDRFRPPYGKHMTDLPRQCVFAGSINPTAGGYLKDPTGARQFWPVACRGMIDRAGLETVPDQLWAEAVHRYKAEACWWLETPELEALATAEQAARFVVDVGRNPSVKNG